MIKRILENSVKDRLFQGKAILLTGPRQVGKTTLIRKLLDDLDIDFLFLDCDDPTVRRLLDEPNTEQLRSIIGASKLVFIDEAQRVPGIGLTSKLIIDQLQDTQLLISGSSAFDLGNRLQEPLTGRKFTYNLFPICWQEWEDHLGYLQAEQGLEQRLVYGFYPDVLNHPQNHEEILYELADSYLFKDVLSYGGIRKPELIQKLVQALAYQVGQEVSYNEVGQLCGLDPKTVANYIDILEKAFVVFRLPALSRNLRNEIKTNKKIYFYDNGVRNAVINELDPWSLRKDRGALWENFLLSERFKALRYQKSKSQMFFWRTKQQQEIDYLEVNNKQIKAFEFKWNSRRKVAFPLTFRNNYEASFMGVNRDNFREFLNIT